MAYNFGIDSDCLLTHFGILEDTWVGFMLEPYQHSFRKRLAQKPKFYFFDVGIARTLARQHRLSITPKTFAYGEYFEQFFITECYKLCQYFHPDYRLGFIRTKDDLEIDLVIERPVKNLLLIEIKSTTQVDDSMHTTLKLVKKDLSKAEYYCVSNDPIKKISQQGIISCYWQEFLEGLV